MKKVSIFWMVPAIMCSFVTVMLYWVGCQLLKAELVGFGVLFIVVAFAVSFSVLAILNHMFDEMYSDCNENKIKEV
jgi:hypothetical protein